jgi:hypothetical protein
MNAIPYIHKDKMSTQYSQVVAQGMMVQKYSVFITIFLIACFFALVIPTCTAAPGDTLTRGSRFTITITGLPNTPYYMWVASTSTLTGNSGDQPPVIVGSQSGIRKDPPGGPYAIGMYAFNNGNGRTILDDVAPSTPDMSNTNYYGLVTTDRDGRAIVAFQTSSGTATRSFSIKVENPSSAANNNVMVELGLPVKITATPATKATLPSSKSSTTVPVTSTVTTPLPATIALTTIPGPTGTPSQASPSGVEVGILSVIAGLVLTGKRKIFR